MTTPGPARAQAAGVAAALLLSLVLCGHAPRELALRAVSLARFAPRELAVRRLGGSGTAFDRAYFAFLEGARRRLPASAEGVALYGVPEADPYLYLAAYQLAPRSVGRNAGAAPLPAGWIVAAYGAERPPGRVVAAWDGGALVEPLP